MLAAVKDNASKPILPDDHQRDMNMLEAVEKTKADAEIQENINLAIPKVSTRIWESIGRLFWSYFSDTAAILI